MVHMSCGSLCCIYRDYHAYRNHLKRYGHPSEIGYKDVLRTWNPTNLDLERLTELYQKAGALPHDSGCSLRQLRPLELSILAVEPHRQFLQRTGRNFRQLHLQGYHL